MKAQKNVELNNIFSENLTFMETKYTTYSHFYIFNSEYLQHNLSGFNPDNVLDDNTESTFKDYSRRFITVLKDSKKQFANLYLKKTRLPQRKFYNKFHRWYKKNPKFETVNSYPI